MCAIIASINVVLVIVSNLIHKALQYRAGSFLYYYSGCLLVVHLMSLILTG